MALTEKGLNALGHVKTYFPTGAFSAADLSSACGEKIFAATLNAVVSNGYLNKLGGSPVMYEAIPNLIELLDNMDLTSKMVAIIVIFIPQRKQKMMNFILGMTISKLK